MSKIEVQMDLAQMALQGKRYSEAESLYMEIATQNNSYEAWVGIGLCKLYQLAEGRTMEEVLFCMNKAKKIIPNNEVEIDNQLIYHCETLINTYLLVFDSAIVKQKELRKKAQKGALLAGVSIVAGAHTKSNFGTFAALAGAGTGIGVSVDAITKMNSIYEIQNFILNKCSHISKSLNTYLDHSNPNFIRFNEVVNDKVRKVNNAIEFEKISQRWFMNKVSLIAVTFLLWPVGVYGWIMRYKYNKKYNQ